MSKGGAGKVYFVLYLAVILELLIIIVERDEAEEHLMKKQQESMRIVESILTQLQSGAGTEGINTRPQDAIVISDNLPDEQKKLFKKFRTYYIEVGVTDVSSALNMDGMDEAQKKEKAETLKKLANVQELQYEIYYNPSKELNAPDSPPLSEFKKVEQSPQEGMSLANSPNSTATDSWQLLATRKIDLDIKGMKDYQEPIYTDSPKKAGDINKYAPQDSASVNRVFGYSEEKTNKLKQNTKLTKRAFVCNFQPDGREGWYKLRFSSQTNRILGISADQKFNALKDDQKVNIGTVQLKVKDLKSVQRQLSDQLSGTGIPSSEAFANGSLDLEKFNDQLEVAKKKVSDNGGDKVAQNTSRIDLYGYIAKLLSPGRYTSFDQNRGSIEIDIFVQSPKIEEGKPDVVWYDEEAYTFDAAPNIKLKLNTNYYNKSGINPPIVKVGDIAYKPNKIISQTPNSKAERGDWIIQIPMSVIKIEPGNESKTVTAIATFGDRQESKSTDTVKITVFKTGLSAIAKINSNESNNNNDSDDESSNPEDKLKEEIAESGRGFRLKFQAKPTSGGAIPAKQFRTYITGTSKSGGDLTQQAPHIGYSISEMDNYFIPLNSNSVSLKIVWINPNDSLSEPVQIFPLGGGAATIEIQMPKPKIQKIFISEITSLNTPTFDVRIEITPPDIDPKIPGDKVNIAIKPPSFQLLPLSGQANAKGSSGKSSNAREIVKGYSFEPESLVKSGEYVWTQRFTVKGKRLTKKFQIGVKVRVEAEASIEGDNSKRSKTFSGEIRVSQSAK